MHLINTKYYLFEGTGGNSRTIEGLGVYELGSHSRNSYVKWSHRELHSDNKVAV